MSFAFRHAICNEVFEGHPFHEAARTIRSIGYTGIEIAPFTLSEAPAAIPSDQRRQYRGIISSEGLQFAGLHWLMVAPKGLHVTTPDESLRRKSWQHIRDLIDLCADLGDGGVMVFGSPKQRCTTDGATVAEATARFRDGLADVSGQAMERGVTLLVEALPAGQCDVVRTLEEAVDIVRSIGSPAVRTMFDTHNAVDEVEPHAVLVDRYFDYIRHVHVNEMDGRHPGTGDYDFKPVLGTLKRRNYGGWVSLEAFDFTPGAERVASETFHYLTAQTAKLIQMKKYIVTGGAGFIGSALVRALLAEDDCEVEVIDNLLSGHRKNLAGIESGVVLHVLDIRDYDAIAPVIAGADVVFHLAAIPSVPRSIDEPVPSHEVNINGTFNVYRAAAEGKCGRVVYAASSSAYGDTAVLPKVETMRPMPLSPYAAQKLMGEYYASVFSNCFGLETVSLRFFNVYGPRQDPSSPYSGVLSLFMKHLIARTPPTIFGDGGQTRDFTYVEDVAALVIKASKAKGVSGKVYNAGNGERCSLIALWDLLQQVEGVRIAPKFGPPRAGDVRDSQADTAAAVRDLGHAPKFTIEDGLRRTLAWYKQDAAGAAPAVP